MDDILMSILKQERKEGQFISIYVDADLANKSLKWAKDNGTSRSRLVNYLLDEFLKERDNEQENRVADPA